MRAVALRILREDLCRFTTFAVAALVLTWHSLGYDWVFDDLHLVRTYSITELAGTLSGSWDPDRLEEPGLRPLTTLFNHVRATVFGEAVTTHRLFLVALFAAYLTLLGRFAVRAGEHRWAAVAAGLIAITAKNNYYHVVWLTEGMQLLQALLVVGFAHVLLRHLEGGSRESGIGSLVLAALALLTREDSLAVIAAVLLIAAYAVPGARRRLGTHAAWLGAVAAAIWLWRFAAVPEARQPFGEGPGLRGPASMMFWTVCLSGPGAESRWLFLAVGAAALASLFVVDARDRRRAGMWLAASLLTTAPGLAVRGPNLLLFPISFYALFLASVGLAVARRRRGMRVPVALLLGVICVLSGRASQTAQLSTHPLSADQIVASWAFVYGPFREATIPAPRREIATARLARVGVADPAFKPETWETALRGLAGSRPDGDRVFIPEMRFLQP